MKKAYLTLDPPREPDGTLCRTGLRRSAPVVLLPGDPQRSRKMAALFAEASFTAHRGTFATYTGKTPGLSLIHILWNTRGEYAVIFT